MGPHRPQRCDESPSAGTERSSRLRGPSARDADDKGPDQLLPGEPSTNHEQRFPHSAPTSNGMTGRIWRPLLLSLLSVSAFACGDGLGTGEQFLRLLILPFFVAFFVGGIFFVAFFVGGIFYTISAIFRSVGDRVQYRRNYRVADAIRSEREEKRRTGREVEVSKAIHKGRSEQSRGEQRDLRTREISETSDSKASSYAQLHQADEGKASQLSGRNETGHSGSRQQQQHKNGWATAGLILGIISVFTGGALGIVPILAMISSGIGLAKAKRLGGEGRGKAFVGFILGCIYIVVNMYQYGHI